MHVRQLIRRVHFRVELQEVAIEILELEDFVVEEVGTRGRMVLIVEVGGFLEVDRRGDEARIALLAEVIREVAEVRHHRALEARERDLVRDDGGRRHLRAAQ